MTFRSASLLALLLVVAAGAGCASSGPQGGASSAAGFEGCADLYPPVISGYGYSAFSYAQANYDDGLCSAYLHDGSYPEFVVQAPLTRHVTSAEPREHRGHVVTRPGDPDSWGSRSANGSSDASSSGSSGSSSGGAAAPRMEPIPVSSPAPAPAPASAAVQPREH